MNRKQNLKVTLFVLTLAICMVGVRLVSAHLAGIPIREPEAVNKIAAPLGTIVGGDISADPAPPQAIPADSGHSAGEDASVYRVRLASSGIFPEVLIVPIDAQVAWTNGTSQTQVLRSGELSLVFLPILLRASGDLSADSAVLPAQLAQRTSLFDVTLAPGQTFTYTFSTVGTFPYYVGARAQFKGRVIVTQAGLPPDPGSVATTVDPSTVTDIADSTAFLYSGDNPIQVGVDPGTIEARRVGVLRGRVLGSDGAPISGVQVAVLDHSEYGQTLTRLDGRFDLAANGGGLLTLTYQKAGYLAVQRQQDVPWRNFVELPEVTMLAADANVGAVDLASSAMQVVQGSLVTDADGSRQATLLIPPGTQAILVFPGGDTQALASFHARITEYTVGDKGQQAMPAELPMQSGYTYADEYSVDEAVAAGAQGVEFSQPLIHYSQNFLQFPVGSPVPAGYYDGVKGQWVPSQNGRVVQITGITGGLAELDTDGDGIADNGAVITPSMVLSITTQERQQLAGLYTAGTSLWRVPVSHFSAWDCNWPYTPPADAKQPENQPPNNDHQDESCHSNGSDIDCQNQILGERVDIAGTPFALTYESDRVPGRKSAYSLDIPLTGPDVPTSTRRVDLDVLVAGQEFTQTFPTLPNQMYRFTWDGKDAYGRMLQGDQLATIRVGYVYTATYQEPAQFDQAFAAFSGIPLSGNRARQEATLWQEFQVPIGAWDARGLGLGGWSLNVQHVYDPNSRVLHLGDGGQRSVESTGQVITTVVGTDATVNAGDGGPAGQASLYYPTSVAVAPDGSLYIASNERVRRVSPDGIISTVAGGGNPPDNLGDGGPAIQAEFTSSGIALGQDGSLYIADDWHNRVRRVSPNGIITTIAGDGTDGFGGDGGPATQAQLSGPQGLAIGSDGSLYIADYYNGRVRRVGTDGIITTVAGGGDPGDGVGDGGPANLASLGNGALDVKVGPDGSLYITQRLPNLVRRVGLDGIITTVAGGGDPPDGLGDGGPATAAALSGMPVGLAVARDGTLYISEMMADLSRIRRVGPGGTIFTFAGTGDPGFSGDGGQPTRAQLNSPQGMALGQDGSLYIADMENSRIRRIGPDLPGFTAGESLIPSEDGREVYVFSGAGRHLRTLDALTAAIRYQFTYDSAGHLIQVTDGYSNTTRIERDATGLPTAIVAPFGQRTALSVNVDSYLASIANPAGEVQQFTYDAGGLLASLTDARGNVHYFSYDPQGRLARDADPAGGFRTLARVEAGRAYTVTLTTALSQTTTFRTELLPQGGRQDTNTFPDGTVTRFLVNLDGSVTGRYPDGTYLAATLGPDPRWGMRSPLLAGYVISTPSGVALSMTTTSTATLGNPIDPFSLIALTSTTWLNDHRYTGVYTSSTRTQVSTTPTGRQTRQVLDAHGQIVQQQLVGLSPVSYTYDNQGHWTGYTVGAGPDARTTSLTYNSAGYIDTLTDPMGRSTSFGYDGAGRVITQTLPDGQVIQASYDANGNLISITPPGQPAHTFAYSAVDLMTAYTPPAVGGSTPTIYTYNLDGQLTRTARPDGLTIDQAYDGAGRLITLTLPRGPVSYGYSTGTGQLLTVTAPGGVHLAYSYDGVLLTGETWSGPVSGNVTRTYNNDLLVSSLAVGGGPIAFAYDDDGLLTQAGSLTLSRDAQTGLISGEALGSVADTRSYNGAGEITSFAATYGGSSLLSRQYARDKLGRVTQLTETVAGVTTIYAYTYNVAGRLAAVAQNSTTVAQYTYDANGNRLTFTDTGGTINGTYDAQDRLTQYGTTTYAYTANGELASKTAGGQTTTYTYDPLGNLMHVSLPGGTVIDYLVDGQNRRIGKEVDGTLAQGFVYQDQLKPIAELDGAGNIVSRFVYAEYDNVPVYMIRGGVTYRFILDHLGSVRLVVNAATGAIAQRMDYDAFGNVTQDTNPGFQPFGFAGGLYDRDTKLVRFGARDYDPETGRWTTKDPILFDGGQTNLYAYADGDPVNGTDSTGLGSEDETPGRFGKMKPPGGRSEAERLNKEAGKRGKDSVNPYGNKATQKGYECGNALGGSEGASAGSNQPTKGKREIKEWKNL